MKIPKNGSSLRQIAYARRVYGAQGETKKEIALDVGYSPAVANSVISKIESKRGFNNAMAKLAADSNNLALEVMSELKARGFEEFSNKELTNALTAITNAWAKFNDAGKPKDPDHETERAKGNKLRTVILQRVENQTVNTTKETILPVDEMTKEEEDMVDEIEDELVEKEEGNPDDLGF